MKNFLFESIEDDTKNLLSFINDNIGDLKIYFDCQGGCCHRTKAIIDAINNNADRIELIAIGYLFSNGFNIFFKSKCKRQIIGECLGMCHQSGKEYRFIENGNIKYKGDKVEVENYLKTHLDQVNFLRELGLNDDEIKRYDQGKDVYFKAERLMELFNNQTK